MSLKLKLEDIFKAAKRKEITKRKKDYLTSGGVSIEYFQKQTSPRHNDSFWYYGDVAKLTQGDREILVVASGETVIKERNGGVVYSGGRERGEGIDLKDDSDLKKIGGGGGGEPYYWENNNWFEFFFKKTNWDEWHFVEEDAEYGYEEAIITGRGYLDNASLFGNPTSTAPANEDIFKAAKPEEVKKRRNQMPKPKCEECGKDDQVVRATYHDEAAYWECERCNCVVEPIYEPEPDIDEEKGLMNLRMAGLNED